MVDVKWEELWREVEVGFAGSLFGIHGREHWRQVERNGIWLGEQNELDAERILVVRVFAAVHDSQRVNDSWDQGHGERAGEFARRVRGRLFEMDDVLFGKLVRACARHELGEVTEDLVMGCCWDADRLDLVRIGARPREELMSTGAGKRRAREG